LKIIVISNAKFRRNVRFERRIVKDTHPIATFFVEYVLHVRRHSYIFYETHRT